MIFYQNIIEKKSKKQSIFNPDIFVRPSKKVAIENYGRLLEFNTTLPQPCERYIISNMGDYKIVVNF